MRKCLIWWLQGECLALREGGREKQTEAVAIDGIVASYTLKTQTSQMKDKTKSM